MERYVDKFKVRFYDVDFKERLRLSALFNYFQDIATVHGGNMGFSQPFMNARRQLWVISRITVEIIRLPRFGEEVTVDTYPVAPGMIDFERDYRVLDADGKLLCNGSSKWCILDADTHAIKRISKSLDTGDMEFMTERVIDGANGKVAPLSDAAVPCAPFTIGANDLDLNRHVNNSRYADFLFNALPMDDAERNMKFCTVNYLKELHYGDSVRVFLDKTADGTLAEIRRDGDDSPVFKADIKFY